MPGILRRRKDGSAGALGKGPVPGALLSPLVTLKARLHSHLPCLPCHFYLWSWGIIQYLGIEILFLHLSCNKAMWTFRIDGWWIANAGSLLELVVWPQEGDVRHCVLTVIVEEKQGRVATLRPWYFTFKLPSSWEGQAWLLSALYCQEAWIRLIKQCWAC